MGARCFKQNKHQSTPDTGLAHEDANKISVVDRNRADVTAKATEREVERTSNTQNVEYANTRSKTVDYPEYWKMCHCRDIAGFSEVFASSFMAAALDAPFAMRGFNIKKVFRLESSMQWSAYVSKMEMMRQTSKMLSPLPKQEAPDFFPEVALALLDCSLNETYLFRTPVLSCVDVEAVEAQKEELRLQTAALKQPQCGMYGYGIYFFETCCQLNSTTAPASDRQYCVLVCRVLCGRVCHVDGPDEDLHNAVDTELHDCVFTEHCEEDANAVGRQIIVFDARQIYPEYAVVCERVDEVPLTTGAWMQAAAAVTALSDAAAVSFAQVADAATAENKTKTLHAKRGSKNQKSHSKPKDSSSQGSKDLSTDAGQSALAATGAVAAGAIAFEGAAAAWEMAAVTKATLDTAQFAVSVGKTAATMAGSAGPATAVAATAAANLAVPFAAGVTVAAAGHAMYQAAQECDNDPKAVSSSLPQSPTTRHRRSGSAPKKRGTRVEAGRKRSPRNPSTADSV